MLSKPRLTRILAFLVGTAALFAAAQAARADRPAAPKLLPEETLAYVRIADVHELVEKFRETSVGQISQDKQINPLIRQLYGSAADAFRDVEDRVGLSLDQLLALPQGEICLALVTPPQGRPAVVGLIDVGDKLPEARKLIEHGEELAQQSGRTLSTQMVGKISVTELYNPNNDQSVFHFEKDQTIVVVNNLDVAKQLIALWDGAKGKNDKSLADNYGFTTIMKRSQGTKDERPQITFFVDPIGIAQVSARGNFTAQAGLAMLPVLGLDGLQAVGGSVILAPEEFDGIVHLHVMLDNPRKGILEMVALREGDTTPESFVPVDAASYWTLNLDVDKAYATFAKMYDGFRGDGALDDAIKTRLSDRLGVDFEKDVIQALAGRATYVTWMEKPARINSQANLIAVKLKDAAKFQGTLDAIVAEVGENLEKKSFGGVTYYQGPSPAVERRNAQPAPEGVQPRIRTPEPCVAIIGDYLVASDSSKFLEQAIATKGNATGSLADDPEYKLIASKIERQIGSGTRPALISFNRPEESFRLLYDLASGEEQRANLAARSENNRFFYALSSALEDNPLPPFSELAKHLAPGGGMLIDDETGLHYIGFTLKRK